MRAMITAAAVSLAIGTVSPAMAQVTVGTPTGAAEDCAPLGCLLRYQQIYASSNFSSAMNITGVTFFGPVGQAGYSGNYTYTLSTTTVALAALSTTFAANITGSVHTLFSGSMSPVANASNEVTVYGPAFWYDPAYGNLLLEVYKDGDGLTPINFWDRYDASADGYGRTSRVFSWADAPEGDVMHDYGMVTRFEVDGPGTVTPEPVTMMLLGTGLAGVAAARRRRQQRA